MAIQCWDGIFEGFERPLVAGTTVRNGSRSDFRVLR